LGHTKWHPHDLSLGLGSDQTPEGSVKRTSDYQFHQMGVSSAGGAPPGQVVRMAGGFNLAINLARGREGRGPPGRATKRCMQASWEFFMCHSGSASGWTGQGRMRGGSIRRTGAAPPAAAPCRPRTRHHCVLGAYFLYHYDPTLTDNVGPCRTRGGSRASTLDQSSGQETLGNPHF